MTDQQLLDRITLDPEDVYKRQVEDGWIYFVHGWSQVVAQVLHVDLTPDVFAALERAAATVR